MLEFDRIETPENVELERRLAGIGSRFIAGFLDHFILTLALIAIVLTIVLILPVGLMDFFEGVGQLSWWALSALIILLFLVYWGYFVLFEMVTNGQSPGKKRMSIRVVREGGGPITFTDVAVRNLLRPVDGVGLYGVGGVCMFLGRKVQRLGDLAAGTVVVSEQVPDYSARGDRPSGVAWERPATADALRATGLTPREFSLLSNYWSRREELAVEARERVLPKLLGPILRRAGHTPADLSVEALEGYVEALLAKAEQGGAGTPSPTPGAEG